MGLVEAIKAMLTNPAGFYAKVKPEEANKAVSFLLIMAAATAVLNFLGGLLHLRLTPLFFRWCSRSSWSPS